MKRYNCTVGDKRGSFGDCMEEMPSGLWVRYSDAEKKDRVIKQLQDKIRKLEGK